MEFESFWESEGPLVNSEDVIASSLREAALRTGGTVTRERYEVLVFEREAPWRGGQGARVTRMNVEPSQLSSIEDAVAWYGDTVVPQLADTGGFCAALLYADWASGRLISETVWQDPHALATSRGTATAGEAAAAEALKGVIAAGGEYRLVFSSARPARTAHHPRHHRRRRRGRLPVRPVVRPGAAPPRPARPLHPGLTQAIPFRRRGRGPAAGDEPASAATPAGQRWHELTGGSRQAAVQAGDPATARGHAMG